MRFASIALRGAAVMALSAAAATVAGIAPAQAEQVQCLNGSTCVKPTGGGAGQAAQAYVGLRWNFGEQKPAVVTGVRFTNTDESGLVLGAKLDAAFTLGGASLAPTVRLLGVAGNSFIQGEAGFGIDTATWTALIAGGVQVPYAAAGANISFDGYVAPYVEANLLGKPAAPTGGTKCEAGYIPHDVHQDGPDSFFVEIGNIVIQVASQYISNGKTCVQPLI